MKESIYQKLINCLQKIAPTQVFIVTDSVVGPIYGSSIALELRESGFSTARIEFLAGEEHKTRATKAFIEDQLFAHNAGRDCCIIALGGGVVLDIVGFVASTYMRGVPYISIPTTLLAMCDASIGGKTGINTSYGKNLIGSYYMPEAVLLDAQFLHTLPEQEMKNGIVEMIKHAAILDRDYFEFLERKPPVEQAVEWSIALKSKVVSQDQREKAFRRILNFGHTVGHAIEALSNYSISHGRAVAIGMLLESQIAEEMGYFSAYDRLKNIFEIYGIDLTLDRSLDDLYFQMCRDKKSQNSAPRIVILKEIGICESFDGVYCVECPRLICQKLQTVKTKALLL